MSLASCLAGGFRPVSPDPVLWVNDDRHDFGDVSGMETVSHVFTVRNMGAKDLSVDRVQTSCGCTAAVLGQQLLPSGATTQLKVTFDPRGRQGRQGRTIWIHSNDPNMPRKQLLIIANIQAPAPTPSPEASAAEEPAAPQSQEALPSSPAGQEAPSPAP